MTWFKSLLAPILEGIAAACLFVALQMLTTPAYAGNWGEVAVVSETMGVYDSRICIGEASRGDLGCPTYAPTISPTGRINATAGLTADSVSLTTTGTTWGYLGSGANYLPNLSSNAISVTNISATTINGIAVSALGSSSGTVISGTTSMINGWPDAIVCTMSSGPMSGETRVQTIATRTPSYVIYSDVYSYSNMNPNAATDFLFNVGDGSFYQARGYTASDCHNKSISQLYADGQAFNFIGNSGAGGGGALGDRITSGTTSVVAKSSGAIEVSGSVQVSGTIQLMSATTVPVCTLATIGTIARINGKTVQCRL